MKIELFFIEKKKRDRKKFKIPIFFSRESRRESRVIRPSAVSLRPINKGAEDVAKLRRGEGKLFHLNIFFTIYKLLYS